MQNNFCVLVSITDMDQVLNIILQIFYKQLGEQTVFKIWWMYHLFFLLNVYVVANVYIYVDSSRKFQEFSIFSHNFLKYYNKIAPKTLNISANGEDFDKLNEVDFGDIMFEKVFHDKDGTLRFDQLRHGFNRKLSFFPCFKLKLLLRI